MMRLVMSMFLLSVAAAGGVTVDSERVTVSIDVQM